MRRAGTLLLAFFALAPAARAAPVTLAQVGTFSSPTYVTSPPGDGRLFVVEQGGRVRVVRDGATLARPFLDVSGRIVAGGEQGLLSIAFPSDYAASGLFYAYFTNTTGDIEVDELRRSADPDVADPAYQRTLFTINHREFGNHNGGQLQFGPDGVLYAGTGDGGGGGDPHNNAQNPSSLLGKLLRIDPRDPLARPSAFAIGLRNPWRFSFDRQTGDLVIGDVGQDRVEEIDFAAAPARGQGANYGWNRFEGNEDFSTHTPVTNPPPGFTFPVVTHTHTAGWCSITGGYVVRDPNLPELAGRYVYGDYCKGDLYAATLPAASDDAPIGLHVAALSSFGEDACGEVYATSLNGPVYRLTSGASNGCAAPVSAPAPGGGAPPAGPPVNGGGASGAAPDRTAPTVRLTAARRQRARRTIRVTLSCDERCTAALRARGLDRRAALAHRTLAPRARVGVRLTLTRAFQRALRRSLRRHRSVALIVRVRAVDAAGNGRSAALRLSVLR